MLNVKFSESSRPCYAVSVLAIRRTTFQTVEHGRNVTFGPRIVSTDSPEKASEIAISDFMEANQLTTDEYEFLTAVAPITWRIDFTQSDNNVSIGLTLQSLNDQPEHRAVAELMQTHRYTFKRIVKGHDFSRSPSFMQANDRTGQDYLNN
ncbi:MAG: hypothetical protein KDE51_19280 [Anaerolineales bacterium]|nr:hypothetical protein [Anaerolineales bacterium]